MATDETASRGRPRPWLLILLAVAAVALIANWMWPTDSTGLVGPSSNVAQPTARREQGKVDPAELQVRLDELSTARPEVGASQRNPFRFQPKAPPAPPPQAALPAVANPGPAAGHRSAAAAAHSAEVHRDRGEAGRPEGRRDE